LDTPALSAMPSRPQTVFRARIAGDTIDLRESPFARDRAAWTDPADYGECQRFGKVARDANVAAIRYESVGHRERDGCCAVLALRAFAKPAPVEWQTWNLSVTRDRVVWQRSDPVRAEAFEFVFTHD